MIYGHSLDFLADTIKVTRKKIIWNLPFKNFLMFEEKDSSLKRRLTYYAKHMKPMKPVPWLIKPFYFFKTYRFQGLFQWHKETE